VEELGLVTEVVEVVAVAVIAGVVLVLMLLVAAGSGVDCVATIDSPVRMGKKKL
jgi:hypothetical protein